MARPSAIPSLVLLLANAGLVTAAPTTAPSTRPATAPTTAVAVDPAIEANFDRLADADPSVRDAAQQWLMGLPADALPRLQAIVQRANPLRPVQAAALHEVVCHVWLTGDAYTPVKPGNDGNPPSSKFVMGLRWPFDASGVRLGVPVVERWPGFPARRVLRDGDMILGVIFDKRLGVTEPPNTLTNQADILRTAVRAHAEQGQRDIDMIVLRDGQQIRVSLTLVPQADDNVSPTGPGVDAFLNFRMQRAEAYWQEHFAPTVDPILDAAPDSPASLDH